MTKRIDHPVLELHLVGWLVVGWLLAWLAGCLAGRLVGLPGWLVGSAGWLLGWLAWLVAWLAGKSRPWRWVVAGDGWLAVRIHTNPT